jgi:hypothetical protein
VFLDRFDIRKAAQQSEKMSKVVFSNSHTGFRLSDHALMWLAEKGVVDNKLRSYRFGNVARHDPLLVAVIEKMGVDACGKRSVLRVCEIPGKQYTIVEYDGAEEVFFPEMEWEVNLST